MLALFVVLSILFAALFGVAAFYLIRFAKIIMILEDDFSDAVDSLGDVETQLEKILGMQMFFDSPEVKLVVQEAMSKVKESRTTVNKLVQKFVQRSKSKYNVIVEEESVEELKERIMRDKMLREGNGGSSGFGNGF